MPASVRKILVVLLAHISVIAASGQVATGNYTYGTFDNFGFDSINVGNLNVHFNIPVLNKAGRGTPFFYNLVYDSSLWYPASVSGSSVWTPEPDFGWIGQTALISGYVTWSTKGYACESDFSRVASWNVYNKWIYHDTLGIQHPFSGELIYDPAGCSGSISTSFSSKTNDGSGITISVSSTAGRPYTAQVYATNNAGKKVTVPTSESGGTASVADSNGNEVSLNTSGAYTDTTGNVVLTVSGSGTATSPKLLTYTDTTGASRTVTMSYSNYTVKTNFGCNGVSEYGPTTVPLVSSVVFPDGSEYQFNYESTPGYTGDVTGRIASITLPQGGTISYAYSGGSGGIVCTDGSASGITRTLSSDSGSATSTWSYARTFPNGTGTSHTEVVDGVGNYKAYDFVEARNQYSSTSAAYYETSRRVYNGAESTTPVVSQLTCYDANTSACSTNRFTLPVTQIDTYTTLDGAETNGITAKYDANSMQTEADYYDFAAGSASRGSLLKKEVWTYGYSIANLPTLYLAYDGSGNLTNEIVYTYDGSTPVASSGVPQHVPPGGARGNLTNVLQYFNSGGAYSTNYTYEDTGNLLTTKNPASQTTTLSYDSSFVYNTGIIFATPSSGIAISSSESFDSSYTGLPLTTTDPNGQVASIASYDSMLRPTEVDSPDGGKATWSYSPTTVTQNTFQTSNVYSQTEAQLDSYGRASRTFVANGQSGNPFYQQDTCYDANSNVSYTSFPYQGSGNNSTKSCANSSSPGTTISYDVLGRITRVVSGNGATSETTAYSYNGRAAQVTDTNGVSRITQVDGLGRPTIVCEVAAVTLTDGNTSPSNCGTDISATGYTTTYAYTPSTGTTSITQGAQTRTFVTDWLGRTISVTEPESGTTTYAYAYNSTGLAVTRTRPMANQSSSTVYATTKTQYDSLSRPVSINYSDGTPTKTYTYDKSAGTNFTDLSQTNLKGRLSLDAVSNAMTAYSYDAMGRVSYLDECLPSGCGTAANNHLLHYTYDLAGNLLSSTDGAGITSTYTFTVANENSSLISSKSDTNDPANLVSSVVNGPYGPASYLLGNGLYGVLSYDAFGRRNGGWVCNGSSSANCSGGSAIYSSSNAWSGAQLTASYDSVLGQTAAYGYDTFNRLISRTITAGTVQNLAWDYDRYGNRWHQTVTAGSAPQPSLSFNAANNQIVGYVYDAAGNMANDSFHTYTYDADGHITSVDGGQTASYVYDALAHRVRSVVGAVSTEYVFNASGQRVSEWNGATLAQIKGKYYWGVTPVAYYSGGAAHFEYQDWLGTERLRTSYNGGVEGSFTSLPWGDGQASTGADGDANHYATLDHDAESSTEHAQFRQLSTTQGRWLSPDPYVGSYDFSNPQSFNRYAYAGNNPLVMIDPSGLDDNCGSGEAKDEAVVVRAHAMDTNGCSSDGGSSGWVSVGNGSGFSGISNIGYYGDQYGNIYYWNGSTLLMYSPQSITVYGWSDTGDFTNTAFPYRYSESAVGSSGVGNTANTGQRSGYESLFCLGDALKSNGLSLALDAVGLIPAGGSTSAAFSLFHGSAGVSNGRNILNRVKMGTGIIGTASSTNDSSVLGTATGIASVGAALGKAAPVYGQVLSLGALGLDAYKTYKAQSACVDSGKYD